MRGISKNSKPRYYSNPAFSADENDASVLDGTPNANSLHLNNAQHRSVVVGSENQSNLSSRWGQGKSVPPSLRITRYNQIRAAYFEVSKYDGVEIKDTKDREERQKLISNFLSQFIKCIEKSITKNAKNSSITIEGNCYLYKKKIYFPSRRPTGPYNIELDNQLRKILDDIKYIKKNFPKCVDISTIPQLKKEISKYINIDFEIECIKKLIIENNEEKTFKSTQFQDGEVPLLLADDDSN
jgi:hypothetical protein